MKKTRKTKANLLSQAFGFRPGLAVSVVGLGFLAGGVMLTAGAGTTTTTLACKPVAVTDVSAATPDANEVVYSISNQGQGGVTTATVKAGDDCVGPQVSLVSYKAPSANGQPLTAQTINDSQTTTLAASSQVLSVNVPDCFYQIDLVYGQPLDLSTGSTYSSAKRLIWAVNGGNKACAATTPDPTPVLSPTVTPEATPTPSVASTPTRTPNVSVVETPAPTPTVIPLLPGETVPPAESGKGGLTLLPETGQPGSLLTLLGALLITAGLLHIYLSQNKKLIKTFKR